MYWNASNSSGFECNIVFYCACIDYLHFITLMGASIIANSKCRIVHFNLRKWFVSYIIRWKLATTLSPSIKQIFFQIFSYVGRNCIQHSHMNHIYLLYKWLDFLSSQTVEQRTWMKRISNLYTRTTVASQMPFFSYTLTPLWDVLPRLKYAVSLTQARRLPVRGLYDRGRCPPDATPRHNFNSSDTTDDKPTSPFLADSRHVWNISGNSYWENNTVTSSSIHDNQHNSQRGTH